mmetsp:Transcript_17744/g.55123  ORF Transcript_17744/g.55123 Transcript_17744/m.55123 type:complete len:377 (+) Transcript_17744:1295-2425(+)
MQVGVCAVPLHRDDLQVASKVARIEPRERQAVAVACEHRRALHHRATAVLRRLLGKHRQRRRVRRGVQVRPDAATAAARDAAALVADLEGDVLVAIRHHQAHWRRVAVGISVALRHRAQRVLDQLEEALVQVARHVREAQVAVGEDLHLRCEPIVSQTHRPRVGDGVLGHLHRRRARTDEPDPVVRRRAHNSTPIPTANATTRLDRRRMRIVQCYVLPDEHAQPDARHIEAVKKGVDLGQVGPVGIKALAPRLAAALLGQLLLQLRDPQRHHGHNICVPRQHAPDQRRERRLILGGAHRRRRADLTERLDVPVADLGDGLLLREPHGQVFQLRHAVRQPHGQLRLQKLRADGQVLLGGLAAELHHVLEAHARLLLE